MDTNIRFPTMEVLDRGIKDYRMIYAMALSGNKHLMADGILGLGKPHQEITLD